MRVRDLMTGAPITVHPDTSMLDARCLMLSKHFRHLLVTKDDQLVGIVTDRDIRLKRRQGQDEGRPLPRP